MNQYLIPANSKKSLLYFGLFNSFDLILFGVGLSSTILLLLILPIDQLIFSLLAVSPGLVTAFLLLPVPNYHNVLTFLRSMYIFFTTRQKFVWKGWCFLDGEQNKEQIYPR